MVVPNLFTAASLFSAMMSIIASADGRFTEACYFILASAVLDALDGPIARLTRSASPFGLQFDSLADTVAFGIAPAFLMYRKLEMIDLTVDLPTYAPSMATGVCALYAVCGAIRLARFNVQAADEEKLRFTGLPIPAAAGVIVSTYLVIDQYLESSRVLHRVLLVLMVVLAYLMVSTYPFPSIKGLTRRARRSMNNFITLIFAIFLAVAFFEHLALLSFMVFMSYLGLSLFHGMRRKRTLATYSPGTRIELDVSEEDEFDEDDELDDDTQDEDNGGNGRQ